MKLLFTAIVGCLTLFFLVGCMEHNTHESSETILVPHGHAGHGAMEHDKIEVDPENPPTVSLEVLEDPKSGWNVHVTTTNFELAPEQASLDHVDGEGHMHLYIDGGKITRLYGNWYHIPADWLKPGTYEISVSLSANDHSDYVIDGGVIADVKTITVVEK